jgi:hypothetical protein
MDLAMDLITDLTMDSIYSEVMIGDVKDIRLYSGSSASKVEARPVVIMTRNKIPYHNICFDRDGDSSCKCCTTGTSHVHAKCDKFILSYIIRALKTNIDLNEFNFYDRMERSKIYDEFGKSIVPAHVYYYKDTPIGDCKVVARLFYVIYDRCYKMCARGDCSNDDYDNKCFNLIAIRDV